MKVETENKTNTVKLDDGKGVELRLVCANNLTMLALFVVIEKMVHENRLTGYTTTCY